MVEEDGRIFEFFETFDPEEWTKYKEAVKLRYIYFMSHWIESRYLKEFEEIDKQIEALQKKKKELKEKMELDLKLIQRLPVEKSVVITEIECRIKDMIEGRECRGLTWYGTPCITANLFDLTHDVLPLLERIVDESPQLIKQSTIDTLNRLLTIDLRQSFSWMTSGDDKQAIEKICGLLKKISEKRPDLFSQEDKQDAKEKLREMMKQNRGIENTTINRDIGRNKQQM